MKALRFALFIAVGAAPVSAQTLRYWDLNGTTAGAGGATPAGTWDLSTTVWNTAADGTGTTANWPNNGIAVFAAGADGTGTYTVNLPFAGIQINGLTIARGNVTFTTGGLTGGAGVPLDVATGATATMSAALSAVGGFTKKGGGTLTFTGFNGIPTPITVEAGMLRVGNSDLGNFPSGNIANQGTVVFNRSTQQTYQGVISGPGTFQKTGATAIMTGDNTYTGGTTITAGELRLGGGGTTGSIVGDIVNNGVLSIQRSNDVALAGAISGTGIVQQQGTGTLALSGNNSFTGNLSVSSGYVQFASAASLGAATNKVVSAGGGLRWAPGNTADISGRLLMPVTSGVMRFDTNGNDVTFATAISNSNAATITKEGVGTLTLANTFSSSSSTLVINGGAIQVGNGGTTGLLSVSTITNNGTIILNRSDNTTQGGSIGGTGALVKNGANSFTLTGNHTFTGGTTINGGTLLVGSGTGGNLVGPVVNHGALVWNRSNDSTASISMTGEGSFAKNGNGTLTVTGDLTHTGGTSVTGGTLQIGNGGTAGWISGDITGPTDTVPVNFMRSDRVVYGGVLGGTIVPSQLGTGTLVLTGDHTTPIVFTVSSGTLQIGDGGNTGSLAGSLSNSATTVIDRSGSLVLPLVVNLGTLIKKGSGTVRFADCDGFGTTTIQEGQLILGKASIGPIVNQATLAYELSQDGTNSYAISGPGSVVKRGTSATLTFVTDSTFTGGLTVTQGLVGFLASAGLGNGTVTLDGGGLRWLGSAVDVSPRLAPLGAGGGMFDTNILTITFTSGVSGPGRLTKLGTGTLALAAAATHTGGTTISAGTLRIGDGGTVGVLAGDVTNNATLAFARSDAHTYAGTISGTGVVTQAGAGILTLAGANTYSGGTVATSGLVQFATLGNLGTGSVTLNGGGLRWADGATVDVSPRLAPLRSGGATFDTNGNNVTLATALTGTSLVKKLGAGTLELTAASTFAGATNVLAGTLRVNNSSGSATSTGAVTVTAGAAVGGAGTIGGTLVAAAGATVAPGNSIGTLSVGAFTWNAGATLAFELGAAGTSDRLAIAGALTKAGAGAYRFDFGGTGAAGTYTLLTFDSQAGFSLQDFSFVGLPPGLSAVFAWANGNKELRVGVGVPPEITSPARADGEVDQPFAYTLTATGGATVFGATGLPPGLAMDPVTGLISGVPASAGVFQVTLRAETAVGLATTAPLVIRLGGRGVQVILSDLRQVYDGTEKHVTVTTDPADIRVTVGCFVDGSPAVPIGAGVYQVWAMVTAADYQGEQAGTLVIVPAITTQPAATRAMVGGAATLSVTAAGGGALTYQWRKNGQLVPGATGPTLALARVQPGDAGLYAVEVAARGAKATSRTAELVVISETKIAGEAVEVATDIRHPNGNIYDQVLLTGASASVRADPGQVTRVSFVDLNDDIVQVEFAGAGTLTVALDAASGPAQATKYNQPQVLYMKGHATLAIADADETTHLSVFSVGRLTAIDPGLFLSTSYDGVADLALIAIASRNGRFGTLRAGNANFFHTQGVTGLYAPEVRLTAPVIVGDVNGSDAATAMLVCGAVDEVQIAGGDLSQVNGQPVEVRGFAQLRLTAGTTSHGTLQPVQPLRGRLVRDGIDVTKLLVPSN